MREMGLLTRQKNGTYYPVIVRLCEELVELIKNVYSRHLLRLWLRDPENAWPIPDVLKPRWAQLYDGVTPEGEVFPLEPYIRSASNKGR